MANSEIFSDFTTRRHTTTPEKFGDKIGENRTDLYTEMMYVYVCCQIERISPGSPEPGRFPWFPDPIVY